MSKSLVVVAHADDESLSCAGFILNRLARQEGEVHVLVVCTRVYTGDDADYKKERQAAHLGAAIDTLRSHPLAKGKLDYMYTAMPEGEPYSEGYYKWLRIVETALTLHEYREVVIPAENHLNQDHRHLHDVCKIALRPGNLGNVRRILMWHPHDGGTPQGVNWFERMDFQAMETKKKAVACYHDEARKVPHPRAPANLLAHARMVGSMAGMEYGEPYTLYLSR